MTTRNKRKQNTRRRNKIERSWTYKIDNMHYCFTLIRKSLTNAGNSIKQIAPAMRDIIT